MSTNANQKLTLTPAEAFNILVQVAAHKDLRLNLAEHQAVQVALDTIKPLVEGDATKLTLAPESATV